MSEPISVRHVIASAEVTERITKAEAATQQALGEDFTKELSKQEALKHTRVAKKDENEKIRNEDKRKKREEEQRKREAAQAAESENEDTGEAAPPATDHIIDLQV
jgi:hypothetical protein